VGGWFIVVVSLPPWYYGISVGDVKAYRKCFDLMVSVCRELKGIGLKSALHLGFHPAEVDRYSRLGLRPERIKKLGFQVIDLAAKYIEEGLAQGFGEVGRQHYPTSKLNVEIAVSIMKYALIKATDLRAPVHLHLEQGGEKTIDWIERVVKSEGIDRRLLILHHIDPLSLGCAIERGFWTTILGTKENLKIVAKNPPRYLVESDFLDDPKRPGAVIVPWSVPRAWRQVIESGFCNEQYVREVNVANPCRIYGFE